MPPSVEGGLVFIPSQFGRKDPHFLSIGFPRAFAPLFFGIVTHRSSVKLAKPVTDPLAGVELAERIGNRILHGRLPQ